MEKAYKGMGMEGSVARWYEKTTRKDYEEYRRLAGRFGGRASGGWRCARSGARTGISFRRDGEDGTAGG